MQTPNDTAQSPQQPLIDIAEVARGLGVDVRHVRRLVAERRIPFIKWGHSAPLRSRRHRQLAGRPPLPSYALLSVVTPSSYDRDTPRGSPFARPSVRLTRSDARGAHREARDGTLAGP
jgi:excisionase family DNA binding protein